MRILTFIIALTCLALTAPTGLAQKVGSKAPDFTVSAQNSAEQISLEKHKGKIVVLFFWRTNDSASIDTIPKLNAIHKNLSKKGVVIISQTNEEREKVEPVMKGKEIEFAVISGSDLQKTYQVTSVPRVFLIDTTGTITWVGHPADDLEEHIKEQMSKTPPAGSEPATLKIRLNKAQAAFEKNELGWAYALAKGVLDVSEKDSELGQKAKSLLDKVDEAAKKWIEEAKDAKPDKAQETCDRMAVLSLLMAGSERGKEAEEQISKLRGDSKTKNLIKVSLDNVKGLIRNQDAADLEALKQYNEAVTIYREVAEKYGSTTAGKEAQAAIDRINGDPKIQELIKAARTNDEANRWLDIGDRYARVEMNDLAREMYQKVITTHPRSQAATKAKRRLEKLPKDDASSQPTSKPTEKVAAEKDKGKGGDKPKDGGKGGDTSGEKKPG